MCADSYSVSVPPPTPPPPPMLPQWHVKDSGHSAKSAGGRLHLNTHTSLTQRSRGGLTMPLSRQCGNLSGNELTRNLSENIWPQSSQIAEPLWTDPGIKSGISVCELISTFKKNDNNFKKRWREMNGRTLSQNLRKRGLEDKAISTITPSF